MKFLKRGYCTGAVMTRRPGPFNIRRTVNSRLDCLWLFLKDMFYASIYLAGPIVVGALLAIFAVWATGLHRVLF